MSKKSNLSRRLVDGHDLAKMQWCFGILLACWLLISIAAAVVALCITHDAYTLSILTSGTPPTYLLYRIAKYLFPMDKREYKLALKKAEIKAIWPKRIGTPQKTADQ